MSVLDIGDRLDKGDFMRFVILLLAFILLHSSAWAQDHADHKKVPEKQTPEFTQFMKEMDDGMKKMMDDMQKDVTGSVRLKLYKGNCTVIGRKSEKSLYHGAFATFEKDTVYNQQDAEGFIRLNALRLRIRRMLRE